MTGISKMWVVLHVSTCWKNDVRIGRYMILSAWAEMKNIDLHVTQCFTGSCYGKGW